MKTLLILPPEVRILETLPGGSQLPLSDRSREAEDQTQARIEEALRNRHFSVQTITPQLRSQPAYSELKALSRAVNRSIQLHVFGPQPYPAKQHAFTYHLGSVADLLQASHADGLLLIIGYQSESDPSRDWLSIAVVEPEGRIIWYGWRRPQQPFNFNDPASLSTLISTIMADFWEAGS